MWIFFLILGAALILMLCEISGNRDSALNAQDVEPGSQYSPAGLSAWETSVKVLPIFLGGIGFPLSFAHPLPGVVCLVLALGLFLLGKTSKN